ncbi:MAG TPA: hypothetical protein VFG32_11125, partial [Bacteroidota bacterium]|nr:hypothetical protein [Bacteroidota bacterium]
MMVKIGSNSIASSVVVTKTSNLLAKGESDIDRSRLVPFEATTERVLIVRLRMMKNTMEMPVSSTDWAAARS